MLVTRLHHTDLWWGTGHSVTRSLHQLWRGGALIREVTCDASSPHHLTVGRVGLSSSHQLLLYNGPRGLNRSTPFVPLRLKLRL